MIDLQSVVYEAKQIKLPPIEKIIASKDRNNTHNLMNVDVACATHTILP